MAAAQLHFEPTDDVGFLRVEDVDLGERLREVDHVWAAALGKLMSKDGQETPIVVCRLPGKERWTLVAGAHRLVGAQIEGINQLQARVIGANALVRRQSEVSENLHRKDLDPIERAAFVAEFVTIKKLRAGIDPAASAQSVAANARWEKAQKVAADDASLTIGLAYGWAEDAAAQLGFSRATIYNDLLLHRLSPSVVARLRECRHPVLNNATQLRALAKLDDRTQDLVAGRLIDGAKSVSSARAILDQKPAPDPEIKRLSAFIGAFQRMGVTERKAALHELVGMMTPVQAITFRDALAEREEAFK